MLIHFPDNHPLTELEVVVTDDSYRYRSIMGKNEVTLKFSLPYYVQFAAGCWIEFQEQTYYCLTEGSYKKHARHEFEYSVVFEPHAGKLRMWTLRNTVLRDHADEFKFSVALTPTEVVEMIVDNLNARDSGWSVGECIAADHKTFDFNNTKLDVALSLAATEFDTEYEIVDKTINLRKVEYNKDTPLPLSYGKGNGFLPGVGVISSGKQKQFEILIIQGGDQNLDRSIYGEPRWHLPMNKTLVYNGVTYQTDSRGREVTIEGKPLTTMVDLTLDLSEMYPKRVGTVSKVEVIDEANRFVDIIDESIPNELDYRDCRIAGETATITFQSGMLAGRTFDIEQTADSLTGFIHSERRFRLCPQTLDGIEMPAGNFMPAFGDKYAVFGIMLPQAYINNEATKEGVEWDMFREACRYFDEKNVIPFSFSGEIDGIWAKRDWENIVGMLEPGWFVKFSDPDFKPDGYDVRIVGMRDYINNPYSPKVELSNDVVSSGLSTDFAKIDGERQRLDRELQEARGYTSRSYADAIRTAEMLLNAGLQGFSESISPLTINTMQLLVGAKECQFAFVTDDTEHQQVVQKVQEFDKTSKQFRCDAGLLMHYTIGVKADLDGASKYSYWNMPMFQSAALVKEDNDNGENFNEKGYYVYAQCSKNDRTGTFKLSSTAIPMDDNKDDGWYHFLVGILSPEADGTRSYAPMYGFTLIEPGRIVADRMQSSDFNWEKFTGACIDLGSYPKRLILGENAEIITRRLTIKPPDGQVEYDLVQKTNDEIQRLDDALAGMKPNHIGNYDPDVNNDPAKAWIESGTEEQHVREIFTNYTSGKSWIWLRNTNNVYGWSIITDSDVTTALANAASAIVTANAASDAAGEAKELAYLAVDAAEGALGTAEEALNAANLAVGAVSALDYLKEAMKKGSVSIEGGLVLANLLGVTNVGNSQEGKDMVAGMSGIKGDNVAFFADSQPGAYHKAVNYLSGFNGGGGSFSVLAGSTDSATRTITFQSISKTGYEFNYIGLDGYEADMYFGNYDVIFSWRNGSQIVSEYNATDLFSANQGGAGTGSFYWVGSSDNLVIKIVAATSSIFNALQNLTIDGEQKSGSADIPNFLVTKEGVIFAQSGKIGIFNVHKNSIEVITEDGGKMVYNEHGIFLKNADGTDRIEIYSGDVPDLSDAIRTIRDQYKDNQHFPSAVRHTGTSGSFGLMCNTIIPVNSTLKNKATLGASYDFMGWSALISGIDSFWVRVYLYRNGVQYRELCSINLTDQQGNVQHGRSGDITIDDLPNGDYQFGLVATFQNIRTIYGISYEGISFGTYLGFTFDIVFEQSEQRTVIGKNGIASIWSNTEYLVVQKKENLPLKVAIRGDDFSLFKEEGKLNANFKALPTSSAGLNSGDIWRNGNALNIVP